MAITCPPGTEIEPLDEGLFCQLYASTGAWKKDSRIIIPETARERVFMGRVVKMGQGRIVDFTDNGVPFRKPVPCAVGDDVLFFRWHGEELVIDGKYYIVMRMDDIIARVSIPEDGKEFFRFASIGDDTSGLAEARVA